MNFAYVKTKTAKKQGYGYIYLRGCQDGVMRKISTGFTIRWEEWEKYRSLRYRNSTCMGSIGITYGQFATILTQIKTAMEDDFDPMMAGAMIRSIKAGVINGERIEIAGARGSTAMLLADYLQQYIDDMRSGIKLKRGYAVRISDSYIDSIVTLRNRLQIMERKVNRHYTLDEVNMEFQRDYMRWGIEKGLRPNTLNTEFSRLRTVMRRAYEDGLTECEGFRNPEFVPRAQDVDQIFLNQEQIEEMRRLDLTSVEAVVERLQRAHIGKRERKGILDQMNEGFLMRLNYTRDHFIIACLTGQRISDFVRISKEMYTRIGDLDFISLVQTKTNKKVLIPVDKRVDAILTRYGGQVPHVTGCKFNAYLRVVGILLNWTFKAKIDELRMGSKMGPRFCDMLMSHTGRRSFATNAYAARVPLSSIMVITGHSSESSLRNYLKLQAEDKALMAANDFEGIILT